MRSILLVLLSSILLINLSCSFGKQPYTPSVPVSQIPRIEAPSSIKDTLTGGSKQYIVYARAQQDLGVSLQPDDFSVRFTVIDMQTGEAVGGKRLDGKPDEGTTGIAAIVPSTGDYLITVFGESKPFTLTCTVK